jgi:membrane protease YdiL (CAAX protease family)
MTIDHKLKKLGLVESFIIFGSAAILMYVLTHFLIPFISRITGIETIISWFIVGGIGIFIPLILLGLLILKREGYKVTGETLRTRLRFRKLTKSDIIWTFIGFILVILLTLIVMKLLELLIGPYDQSPDFMTFEPLSKGRYWILIIWFPFWLLNIGGEELLWRGVMFPRQELVFGNYTWIIHGLGWGLFHIAFGWKLLLTLIPLIFIQSFIVQKTKNSWTGVILHGGLNGPSFVAISLGLI